MNLLEYLKQYADVLCDEPLAKHTTFRIGGTCDYFVYPKTMLSFMRIMQLLKEQEADGILVFGGGVIPEDDIPELKKAGVSEVFTPGTPTAETVKFLQDHCGARDDG